MRDDYHYPHESLVDYICTELAYYDPYVHSYSENSVYIRFKSLPGGLSHQLRISDHDERAKYGSKWQLRLDWSGIDGTLQLRRSRQWSRYFCDADALLENFRTYYSKVGTKKNWGITE